MLVCPNDRGINHQPFHFGFAGKDFEHRVQHPHFDPTIIAPLYRIMFAKPFGKISPARARTGHPE
jgi:hypothetical protein